MNLKHHCSCKSLPCKHKNFRVGNSLIEFFAKKVKKVTKWAIRSKSEWFAHFWWATWAIRSQLIISSELPERIAHGRLFVLSDLSYSLTSLRRNEQKFSFFKNFQKNCKMVQKIRFFRIFLSEWLIFCERKRNGALCWKKPSASLMCPEQPERIAHICSFVMSDLSDLLTVAHLSWATWANRLHLLICPEQFEQMSHE